MVMVEVPAPGMELGPNETVTDEGCPAAVRAISELNPPATVVVIVVAPLDPGEMFTEDGLADRENPSAVVVLDG